MEIVIVEDDPTAACLLAELVGGGEHHVAAVYASGEEILDALRGRERLPDVVLMDLRLPGISGIETTRRLKADHPRLEIVVQTIFDDSRTILEAIRAGASGYVLKGAGREELRSALDEARRGGSYLTGSVARQVLDALQGPQAPGKGTFGLSAREDEILSALADGAAYKQIADRLGLSVHTVNNHVRRIYEKMQVHSRGEAVAKLNRSRGSER